MKKLLKQARTKLTGQGGESIGEVLIATLISAVALTMLASMLITSSRLISQSREKLESYYQKNNALVMQQSTDTHTGTVIIDKGSDASTDDYYSVSVSYKTNKMDENGKTTVYAYWKQEG